MRSLILFLLALLVIGAIARRHSAEDDARVLLWNPFANAKSFFDNVGAKIKTGFHKKVIQGFQQKIIGPSKTIVNKIKKEDIGNKIKSGFNRAAKAIKNAKIDEHIKNGIVEYGNNLGNTYRNLVTKLGKKETWANYAKNPFTAAVDIASFTNPGMVAFSSATQMMANKIPHVGSVIHDMNPWTTVNRIGNKYGTEAGWKRNIEQWKGDSKSAGMGLVDDLSEAANFIPGAGSGIKAGKTVARSAIKIGLKEGLKAGLKGRIKAGVKAGFKQGINKAMKMRAQKGLKMGMKQGFKKATKPQLKAGIKRALKNKQVKSKLKKFAKKKAKEFAKKNVDSFMNNEE